MKRWNVWLFVFFIIIALPIVTQASHIHSTRAQQSLEELIGGSGRIEILSVQGRVAPPVSDAGRGRIYFDSGTNTFQASQNTGAYVTLVGAGGSAPANATYITQTSHAGLSAEQALSALATGYVKVTTGTGVLSAQAVPFPVADGGTGLTTTTVSQLLYSSATNTVAGLATGNNGVLITSGTGVPSISSTIPSATQNNITRLGTIVYGANANGVVLHLAGSTTLGSGYAISDIATASTATANGNAFMFQIAGAMTSAAAGTHALLSAIDVVWSIANGGAAITNADGINIRTFAAPAPTVTATGLRVAAPTGAATNYAIWSAAGLNRFDGSILHGASATVGTSGAGVYSQAIGTAPTTSPADVFQRTTVDSFGAGTASWQGRDEEGFTYTLGHGMFLLGGTTSAFPAWKRSAALMQARLADDSADATLQALTLRTACVAIASLPAGVEGDRKCVNDQLTSCPVLDGAFTAGGVVRCSAFYNGTAWVHS